MERNKHDALLSWLFVILLVALCVTFGVMQYRWIGEVSRAERERLQVNLQGSLQRLRSNFNTEIRSLTAQIAPQSAPADQDAREREYAGRYATWRTQAKHEGLVRRLAIAVRGEDALALRLLDLDKGTFSTVDWPPEWTPLRGRLTARAYGDPGARMQSFRDAAADEPVLIDLPQFSNSDRNGGGPEATVELGWTVIELDPDHLRSAVIPELLLNELGDGRALDYNAKIVAGRDPSKVIYSSGDMSNADASVALFEPMFPRRGPGGGPPSGERRKKGAGPPVRGFDSGPEQGRWLLSVQHRAGSLEALVAQTRRRNLAVTGSILLLMLAAIGALAQFSRRAQRLAELQMEFVAGVSHELRTPLTVIRTAAHNLRGRIISDPNHVQRYGSLIESESEKLTDIVDRVLLFSNAKAGRVIRVREVVGVDQLVEEAVSASEKVLQESGCEVETNVEPGLLPVFADPTALKHVLLNLIGNAAKYGAEGKWIGISAASSEERKVPMVEIRVVDRGPGIPAAEQAYIFDAFYRGKAPVADQIHGTGLGLSLVRRIVEAHGGTVRAHSEPGKETAFTVRLPAAPAEKIDEFADPVNRR